MTDTTSCYLICDPVALDNHLSKVNEMIENTKEQCIHFDVHDESFTRDSELKVPDTVEEQNIPTNEQRDVNINDISIYTDDENICDMNNNKIIPFTSVSANNLFIRDVNSSKTSCINESTSITNTTVDNEITSTPQINLQNLDAFDYLRSEDIREDIEILVDIYLFFEKTTWILSAFMW